MKTTLMALAVGGMAAWSPILAADPGHELSAAEAAKLIALMNETRDEGIAIVSILEGSKEEDGRFEARHVRRVTAIHPVNEEGRRVRRIHCYDFHWSEGYGWFASEKRQGRGGEEVWIWSETQGEVVVK